MNPAHANMNRTYDRFLITVGAWLLALMWILPLAYAFWTAFHPAEYETHFDLFAPLTLENFTKAWGRLPLLAIF